MDKSVVRQEINLRCSGEASHISWCRVSNLVAISFKAARESEAKICVLEPSQPNLTVTLRVPLKDNKDKLVTLQWSPVGCKRMLLAVTRSGRAVGWMQTKPESDATHTVRTVDEWYGHQVFDLGGEVSSALWLNEPAAMQWTTAAAEKDFRKHSIDTLFVPKESSIDDDDDLEVLNSYWVRPGLLCVAVVMSNMAMQFWWLPMGNFANQMVWRQSPALDLSPYMGKGGLSCMAATTTYGMGVRLAIGMGGESSGRVKVLRVVGDPTFMDINGDPLYSLVVDEMADVLLPPLHVACWLKWSEMRVGTCLTMCSVEPGSGSVQMATFTFTPSNIHDFVPGSPPTLLKWSQQSTCSLSDLLPPSGTLPSSPCVLPASSSSPRPLAMSHCGQQVVVGMGPELQLLVVSELDGLHVGERLEQAGSTSGQNGTLGAAFGGWSSRGGTPLSRSIAEFSPNACCLCVVHLEPGGNSPVHGAGRLATPHSVLRLWCLREPHVPNTPPPSAVASTAVRCAWSWAHAHNCWDVVQRINVMGDGQPKCKAVPETFALLDLLISGLTEHVKPRAAYYLDRIKLQVVQGIPHPEAMRVVIDIKARTMLITLERIFGILQNHRVEVQASHSQDKQKRYQPNDLIAALPWIQWGIDFFWLYLRIIHRWVTKLKQKGRTEQHEPLPLIRFMGDVYLHRRLTTLLNYLITAASQVRQQHVKAPGGYAEVVRMVRVVNVMFKWCMALVPEIQVELNKHMEHGKEPAVQHLVKALSPLHHLWMHLDKHSHIQHKKLTETFKDLSECEQITLMQDKAKEAAEMFPSELRFNLHPYRCYGPVSSTLILDLCGRWNDKLPTISDEEIESQLRHLGLSREDKFPNSTRLPLLAAHQRFRNDAPLPAPPGICRLGAEGAASISDRAGRWRDQIQVGLGQASRSASRYRRDVITMRALGVGDSSQYELLDGSGTTMEYEPHVLAPSMPTPQSFMNHWRRAWLVAGPFSGSAWKRTRAATDAATSEGGADGPPGKRPHT